MRSATAVVALFPVSIFVLSTAPERPPRIELLRGTVNGSTFYELTETEIRQLLGPPTVMTAESTSVADTARFGGRPKLFPSWMYYPRLGLAFILEHSWVDTSRRCAQLVVYMTDQTEAGLHFRGFRGTLSPPVAADWTRDRLLREVPESYMPRTEGDSMDFPVARLIDPFREGKVWIDRPEWEDEVHPWGVIIFWYDWLEPRGLPLTSIWLMRW